MCNNKQVMNDKLNLKWRPPPSWIYYFCPFWSNGLISGGSRLHCCKISFIYVNWRPSYCCLCIFVQYFGMFVCRTSNVIHVPNFVQMCAILNELWAIDEIQNGGPRHLEFIFCPFYLNGLFPVAAVYITAKFHLSTSIRRRVIAVCAKIQDGSCRHLGFYFCSIFRHVYM